MNEFADLTQKEWKNRIGFCSMRQPEPRRHLAKLNPVNTPASVDWRDKGAVTPVKNQLECGSCWAFSSTGSLEGLNFITNGKLESFSEQQLVDCSQSFGNNGCDGGLMDYAFEYVAAKGIESETTYPYKALTGTCRYSKAKVLFKNKAYEDIPQRDNDALAAAVAQQPVSIGIEADTSAFQMYTSGVFNDANCGTNIDHGVLIVGYGTENGNDYWIVKNSWGSSWGESGYIRIAKQSGQGTGVCGVAMSASYPTGNAKNVQNPLAMLLDVGKERLHLREEEANEKEQEFEDDFFLIDDLIDEIEKSINPIIPEENEENREHSEENEENCEHNEESEESRENEENCEHNEEEENREKPSEPFNLGDMLVAFDVDDIIGNINPIIPEAEEASEEEHCEEEAGEEESREEENCEHNEEEENREKPSKPFNLGDMLVAFDVDDIIGNINPIIPEAEEASEEEHCEEEAGEEESREEHCEEEAGEEESREEEGCEENEETKGKPLDEFNLFKFADMLDSYEMNDIIKSINPIIPEAEEASEEEGCEEEGREEESREEECHEEEFREEESREEENCEEESNQEGDIKLLGETFPHTVIERAWLSEEYIKKHSPKNAPNQKEKNLGDLINLLQGDNGEKDVGL